MKHKSLLAVVILASLVMPNLMTGLGHQSSLASAQTGAGYELTWFTLASGGGASEGSGYALGSTLGQPNAGVLSSAEYTLVVGFWGGGAGQYNAPPTVDAGPNASGDEGATIGLDGTVIDPDSAPVTVWSLTAGGGVDAGATCTFGDASAVDTTVTCTDDGAYVATLTANDGVNLPVSDSITVTVTNVAPDVHINAPAGNSRYMTGEAVDLSAAFTDAGINDTHTCTVNWGDGTLAVAGTVTEAAGAGTCTSAHSYTMGGAFMIQVTLTDDDGASDHDTVTIRINTPPNCSAARPSIGAIWPPNHQFAPVNVLGVTDADGDPISILITSIRQDEPVDTYGDGSFTPDGRGVGTNTAWVRAERSGTQKVPGNGRFYHIGFTASDGNGGFCSSVVRVVVPHDRSKTPVDQGPIYDSTKAVP